MLLREQMFMLLIDRDAAVAAIPSLVPADTETRRTVLSLIREVLSARGKLSGEEESHLNEVARLLGLDEGAESKVAVLSSSKTGARLKAS
jgi:hypothetical protein